MTTDNIKEEIDTTNKNEAVEPKRATTPEQSPSTKAKLCKVCIQFLHFFY